MKKMIFSIKMALVVGAMVNGLVGLFGFLDAKLSSNCTQGTVTRLTKYVFPAYVLGCYMGEQVSK